jgi:hypothetical protein
MGNDKVGANLATNAILDRIEELGFELTEKKDNSIFMSYSKSITITVPNKDTCIGQYTIFPKKVLQKGYTDKIGQNIDFNGVPKKVKSVRITEDFIYIELE